MTGVILQIVSWIIGIGGTLLGIISVASGRSYDNPGYLIVGGSLLSWLVLYGIGGAFIHLEDIAADARRSADAAERSAESLEHLTRRQRSAVAQKPQPAQDRPPATVLRNIDTT